LHLAGSLRGSELHLSAPELRQTGGVGIHLRSLVSFKHARLAICELGFQTVRAERCDQRTSLAIDLLLRAATIIRVLIGAKFAVCSAPWFRHGI
jgi:hypothetical protein